jgi:diguanylate cyclase (GGDEF)-like protein
MLAVTVVCVAATFVAGDVTRLRILEEDSWVAHTIEVKLAIAESVLAAERGDAPALRVAEMAVQRLTVDNPVQRDNVARALAINGRPQALGAELLPLLTSMRLEEDRLMISRTRNMEAARGHSSTFFVIGAGLTLALGLLTFAIQRAQGRALASAHQSAARQQGLLTAVIETVDEGIVAVDALRNTIAMNAVARAMVGPAFPRDRLPEDWRHAIQTFYEDGSPMPPEGAPLARAMRGESVDEIKYRIVPVGQLSGGTWVSTSARPIRDFEGRIIAAVATLRNITEQRVRDGVLREQAVTDELTGLLNRRGFVAAAHEKVIAARRTGASLGLLYADVNGLKRINDSLGHEQGDAVIADAARVLRRVVRDGDVAARVGGDEFVVLLLNLEPASSDALLERLAEAIRSHAEGAPSAYRLSLSLGLTFMDHASHQSLDDLLAEADRRMYARKRRNSEMPAVGSRPPIY